jgi:hypothetical protein
MMTKRKNKKQKQRPNKSQSKSAKPTREVVGPPETTIVRIFKNTFKILTAITVFLTISITVLSYWNPLAFSVSRGPVNPSNPLSTYFAMENKWIVRIYNLNIGCFLILNTVNPKRTLEDNYFSNSNLKKDEIQPFEKLEISCPRAMSGMLIDGQIVAADLCIKTSFSYTSYTPWFLQREIFSHFIARQDSSGLFFWTQESNSSCINRFEKILREQKRMRERVNIDLPPP